MGQFSVDRFFSKKVQTVHWTVSTNFATISKLWAAFGVGCRLLMLQGCRMLGQGASWGPPLAPPTPVRGGFQGRIHGRICLQAPGSIYIQWPYPWNFIVIDHFSCRVRSTTMTYVTCDYTEYTGRSSYSLFIALCCPMKYSSECFIHTESATCWIFWSMQKFETRKNVEYPWRISS